MNAQEVENRAIAARNEAIAQIVEDTFVDTFHIRYVAVKEEVETPIFKYVEEALVDIVQEGKLDTLLVMNVDALTGSNSVEDAQAKCLLSNEALITPRAALGRNTLEGFRDEYGPQLVWKWQLRLHDAASRHLMNLLIDWADRGHATNPEARRILAGTEL